MSSFGNGMRVGSTGSAATTAKPSENRIPAGFKAHYNAGTITFRLTGRSARGLTATLMSVKGNVLMGFTTAQAAYTNVVGAQL